MELGALEFGGRVSVDGYGALKEACEVQEEIYAKDEKRDVWLVGGPLILNCSCQQPRNVAEVLLGTRLRIRRQRLFLGAY